MRWHCPPENWCGYLFKSVFSKATSCNACSKISFVKGFLLIINGSLKILSIVWRGSSALKGSWKITPIFESVFENLFSIILPYLYPL